MNLILLDRMGPVAVLSLNRPERHNSLIPEMLEELLAALEAVRADADLRAMVLQANGRSFSTGGDLGGFCRHLHDLETYAQTIVGLLNRVILALMELPLPVVAAVHGLVTGGSMGLVLGSDLVLVAPEASFTPYYSVVGFGPDGGWTAMLPSIIGPKRAAEALMGNLTITAEEAVDWGLANRISPGGQIRKAALEVAQNIAAKKPGSIRHIKRLLAMAPGDVAARLAAERTRFVQQIATEEAQQGIKDFLERRRQPTRQTE
jgi:enoyl-CoA hydratase/carnithine racemase